MTMPNFNSDRDDNVNPFLNNFDALANESKLLEYDKLLILKAKIVSKAKQM